MKRQYLYNQDSRRKPTISPGSKFNSLTVLRFSHYQSFKNQRVACYEVECQCGNTLSVLGVSLKSGNTKSCGCLRKISAQDRVLSDNMAMINAVKGYYKKHCKKYNRVFDLSDTEFKNLIFQECYYCGNKASNDYRNLGVLKYNGIDRVNNNLGYITSNCVSCCKICNTAKSDMSQEDFFKWIKHVNDKHNKDKKSL